MHSTLSDDVYLDEKSFALLLEIQKTLSVFEPIEDDEARKLWLEIPRLQRSGKRLRTHIVGIQMTWKVIVKPWMRIIPVRRNGSLW